MEVTVAKPARHTPQPTLQASIPSCIPLSTPPTTQPHTTSSPTLAVPHALSYTVIPSIQPRMPQHYHTAYEPHLTPSKSNDLPRTSSNPRRQAPTILVPDQQESEDSANNSAKSGIRQGNFGTSEDTSLSQTWVNAPENSIVGSDQKGSSFKIRCAMRATPASSLFTPISALGLRFSSTWRRETRRF